MLSIVIFLPLATALVVLLVPGSRPTTARAVALGGALLTLIAACALLGGAPDASGLRWRTTVPWIPPLHASYDVGVDGLSLPLILLTAVLLVSVMLYVLRRHERPRGHAFLFLLLATGLIGVFSAQDLLLFYLFFEVGLVPMYFIIGIWGHEERHYAALKFFLYTRAASLAMLLAFIGLYLAMEPHTFSLIEIAAANPLAASAPAAGLVLLGLLIGFGVKLPTFPLHNWLPDAHVEAPTEGSVMLAGIQLKMGGYGLLRVLLAAVPAAATRHGWVLVALGLISLVYGVLAALAQRDLKRLIAYTSVNHMGFVMLAAGAWALSSSPGVRQLALDGAVYQMVSHGLLTGGMFYVAGILQDHAHTRDMDRLRGVLSRSPVFGGITAALAFGSLGLPGLSGFVAELQVIGATLAVRLWPAVLIAATLVVTTGLYLRVVVRVLFGEASDEVARAPHIGRRKLVVIGTLMLLSVLLGVLPGPLLALLHDATRSLSAAWTGAGA